MTINMQYVGLKSKAIVREYSFLLWESSIESHEITSTILSEASLRKFRGLERRGSDD
jgi:hypothetical protein